MWNDTKTDNWQVQLRVATGFLRVTFKLRWKKGAGEPACKQQSRDIPITFLVIS